MALDSNLIFGARSQPLDAGAAIARGLSLRSLRNQGRQEDAQLAAQETARQRLVQLRQLQQQAVSGGQFDPDAYAGALEQGGFVDEALAARKGYGELAKQRSDADAAAALTGERKSSTAAKNFETQTKQFDRGLQLLSGAKDQRSYEQGLMQATREGLDVSMLPPMYDPQAVQTMSAQLLGAKERLAASVAQQNADTSRGQLGVSQGNLQNARDRLAYDRDQPKGQFIQTDDGYMLADPRTGEVQPVMANGKPVYGKGNVTEFQGKAAQFASRARQADKNFNDTGKVPGTLSRAADGLMFGLGNYAIPGKTQAALQAEKEFIRTAVLRADSGAAISDGEYKSYGETFFPRPGDSEEVVQQKAAARQRAVEGLEGVAGKNAMRLTAPIARPPAANSKGWTLHTDAAGNSAYVSPDGTHFEEVR